jgi:hypothetical protein
VGKVHTSEKREEKKWTPPMQWKGRVRGKGNHTFYPFFDRFLTVFFFERDTFYRGHD